MIITNPRSEQHHQLQSYVTSEYREYAQPKMTQTHSDRVMIVVSIDQDIGEADGMVTSLYDIELHVRVADCGNIYFYDPRGGVIGLCHSGWKGSQMNIIKNTVDAMVSLGSIAQDILVRTGPCISGKNYEFGPEVKDLFEEQYIIQKDNHAEGNKLHSKSSGRKVFSQKNQYYLDLPALHRDQLIGSGIIAEHVIQSDICTFETLVLPSYRRQGSDSGRITGTIIQIK